MAQGMAWYLGALACNVLGTPSTTLIGGEGLYQATGDPFNGSFLADPEQRLRAIDLGARRGRHRGASPM